MYPMPLGKLEVRLTDLILRTDPKGLMEKLLGVAMKTPKDLLEFRQHTYSTPGAIQSWVIFLGRVFSNAMGREKNDVLLGLLYGEKASQKCILPGVCFRKKAIVKKKKEPATARTRPKGLIYVSNIQLFGENSLTIKLDNLVLIVLEHLGLTSIPPNVHNLLQFRLCENPRCMNPDHFTTSAQFAEEHQKSPYAKYFLKHAYDEYEILTKILCYFQVVSVRKSYLPPPVLNIVSYTNPGSPFKHTHMSLLVHALYFA